jgi:peptidoglycan/LPS O-acetylase OafA/YrhL
MNDTSNLVEKEGKEERIYFPELDGLRFFAFFLVFVHHHDLLAHVPFLSVLNTRGWIGVDLFFVLSSFLFTKLLLAEYQKTQTISFKKFYLRRIFRIYPIYFLFAAFSLAIYIYLKGSINQYLGIRLIGLFTFSDNILTAMYEYNPLPYIQHLWTITFEEQFYLVVPWLILFLVRSTSKTRITLLISIFILFNLIRCILLSNDVTGRALWVLPITHFESIVLGLVLGFGGFNFLQNRIKPGVVGFIGIALFMVLSQLPQVNQSSYWLLLSYPLVGFSTAFVLYAVLNHASLKSFFSKNIFVYLGKRSYGLYIYHLLGNSVAGYLIAKLSFLPTNNLASFIYSLLFTILVSILSYALIETPFLKLKKKFEVIVSRPI